MVTVSEVPPATLAIGFQFMRRQRDPEFRKYLQEIGWTPEQDIVVAFDDDPVSSVVARIVQNQTSSPCLITIPNDTERFGFRFLFAGVARPTRRKWPLRARRTPIEVGPDASIGMLYSSLTRCGEYVPNEWVRPVMFERAAEPV